MLAWSIEHAQLSCHVTRVIVSTDSERYALLAREYGADTPFLRPAELAGDLTTDWEVFDHALRWLEAVEGYRPELCVHLRPTSPLRRPADIDQMIEHLRDHPEFSSARSVSRVLHPPFKMWYRESDGTLAPVIAHVDGVLEPWNEPRQKLPATYLQTASIDVVRPDVVINERSMTGRRIYGYEVDDFVDIDEQSEFDRAHRLLTRQGGVQRAEERPTPAERKTFCFDIDGVIAHLSPDNNYSLAFPAMDVIELVNALYDEGHHIVLFTARGSITGIDWRTVTRSQLAAWNVRYHELLFGKPAADYYIDDRLLSLDELRSWVRQHQEVRI